MIKVHAVIVSTRPHLSEVLTGFLLLQEAGLVDFSYEFNEHFRQEYPYLSFLFAEVNGKKVVFDMMDGYDFSFEAVGRILSGVDFCLKRSYSTVKNEGFPEEVRRKIHPWGLSYHVTCAGNPLDDLHGAAQIKEDLFQILANGARRSYFTPERFENSAHCGGSGKILFLARLWESVGEAEIDEDRAQLNRTRTALVRRLRQEFGGRFVGGVQFSPYAKRIAPELIVPVSFTKRKHFLTSVKAADICVGTTGLFGSVGWKTTEYIAAARAVVSERLQYEAPGGFSAPRNYLEFLTEDECMEQISYLVEHPDAMLQMKEENERYYRNYVRPDQKMKRALEMICSAGGQTR